MLETKVNRFGRRCIADCLKRNKPPSISRLLFTQTGVPDDTVPEERQLGIDAGPTWYDFAEACVVYCDRGIIDDMRESINEANSLGLDVEFRRIGGNYPGPTPPVETFLPRRPGRFIEPLRRHLG
jgi:hypothetical protein